MRKFAVKILLFVILCALADIAVGYGLRWLQIHAGSGQALKTKEVGFDIAPDVLILGSSRSTHHYKPRILEDSLHCTAYIAGQDGNGIVMMYPILRLVAERRKPALVIYDLTVEFDLEQDDMHRYFRYLRPLYGRSAVLDSVVTDIDRTEAVKLLSHSYAFNSSLPSMLKGFCSGEIYENGYVPLYGDFVGELPGTPKGDIRYSDYKVGLLMELMAYCKAEGIGLMFVVSPSYSSDDEAANNFVLDMARNAGFIALDYTFDERFHRQPRWFRDAGHLNDKGAEEFTRILLPEVKAAMDAVRAADNKR